MGAGQSSQIADQSSNLAVPGVSIHGDFHFKDCTSNEASGDGWIGFFAGAVIAGSVVYYYMNTHGETSKTQLQLKSLNREQKRSTRDRERSESKVSDITSDEEEALEVSRLALAYLAIKDNMSTTGEERLKNNKEHKEEQELKDGVRAPAKEYNEMVIDL